MKYEKLGTTNISVSKICYCRMIWRKVLQLAVSHERCMCI